MTTYRVGNHHGVTIVREGDGARCGRPDHDCARGHLVGVVVDGGQEFAEEICAALNGQPHTPDARPCPTCTGPTRETVGMVCQTCGTDYGTADSCTCTKAGPILDCPVHQGRKSRGPKPPPLGSGCICDGSGRTCPRHGAVS